MQTIVVPVSDKRPEDNILDLVNLLEEEFATDLIIHVTNALVIETDNPHVAAIFKKIAESSGGVIESNGKDSAICPDCGTPVSKPGKRCKGCANKFYRAGKKRKPALLEFVTETEPGEGNNGIGEQS
jgi:hypothetical protein